MLANVMVYGDISGFLRTDALGRPVLQFFELV